MLGGGRLTWLLALLLLVACAPTAAPARPSTVALYILPDAGATPVLRAIDRAARSIDLEIYLLSQRSIADALGAARSRGVRVRVLLEQKPFGGATNDGVNRDLQRAGVETRWTSPEFSLTHTKAMVLDGATAWIMTANLTAAAFRQNREYLAVLTDPADVAELGAIFEADWARVAARPERLVVSPTNARRRLTELVQGATRSLEVEAEELVDRQSIEALAAAAGRGVAVRLITNPPPDGQPDANAAGREALARAGGEVRLLRAPYVHAKSIPADRSRLYVGSINLSTQSLDRNREIGAILDAPPALALAAETFERDWAAAR